MSRKPFVKPNQAYKRAIALPLLVWLSGAMCVFGCDLKMTESGNKSLRTQEKSLAAHGDHSCCRRAQTKKEIRPLNEIPNPSTKTSSCPFARQPTEQAGKETTQTAPAAVVSNSLAWLVQADKNLSSSLSYRARLPDRGGTHLSICVFLI